MRIRLNGKGILLSAGARRWLEPGTPFVRDMSHPTKRMFEEGEGS